MTKTFTGVVQFANGSPAPGVRVRLFDKDVFTADDDLTVFEGVSADDGAFTVTYDPERDLDFADIYIPYLEFYYTHQDQMRTHRDYIQPFERVFRLPEFPPVKFIPSRHGLQFVNRFKGYWLPFSIAQMPDIPSVSSAYGLCGGMCATSYDLLLAGLSVPDRRKPPRRVSMLHQYLHRRQVDSLTMGKQVTRFLRWMTMADDAVQLRTAEEIKTVRDNLAHGVPTPIGMVYVSSQETWRIWENHQVLACDYEERDDGIYVQIYDPNYPRRDDVFVKCWPDGHGGLKCAQLMGNQTKHARGFFVMPYRPIVPPSVLIDASAAEEPPPQAS